jgi:hypothetical protein
MVGGQRLISWLHPYSTSNVALNTRTCAHVPLMGHPNWAGCDTRRGGHQAGRPPPLLRVRVSEGGRPTPSSPGKPRESWPGGGDIAATRTEGSPGSADREAAALWWKSTSGMCVASISSPGRRRDRGWLSLLLWAHAHGRRVLGGYVGKSTVRKKLTG